MEDSEYLHEGRGRNAQKRAAKAIEQLARQLAELPETALARLPIKEELGEEIEQARTTKGHGSRKRQIKHLAAFLRRHEDQRLAVEEALAGHAAAERQEVMAFHHLEELRDRLCNPARVESALADIRASFPHIDLNKLARLAHAVHENADKKAAREIFRRLRKAAEESAEPQQ